VCLACLPNSLVSTATTPTVDSLSTGVDAKKAARRDEHPSFPTAHASVRSRLVTRGTPNEWGFFLCETKPIAAAQLKVSPKLFDGR
jgi:hypothetical protein